MAPLIGTLRGQRKTRRNGKGSLLVQQVAGDHETWLCSLPAARLTDPRRDRQAHAPILLMGRLRPGGAKSPGQCRGTCG